VIALPTVLELRPPPLADLGRALPSGSSRRPAVESRCWTCREAAPGPPAARHFRRAGSCSRLLHRPTALSARSPRAGSRSRGGSSPVARVRGFLVDVGHRPHQEALRQAPDHARPRLQPIDHASCASTSARRPETPRSSFAHYGVGVAHRGLIPSTRAVQDADPVFAMRGSRHSTISECEGSYTLSPAAIFLYCGSS
jgi:hypothetical protein